MGDGWVDLVHPDDLSTLDEACTQAFAERKPFIAEFRLRSANGEYRWVLDSGSPHFEADGRFAGFVGSCIDITSHRQGEDQLRQALGLIEGVTDGTEDLIAAQNSQYQYTYFNEAYSREYKKLWGHDLKFGSSMLETMAEWPGELKKAKEIWDRAHSGESFRVTIPFGPDDNQRRIYDLRFNPVRDGDGNQIGAAHIVRDVTDQISMENALRESETRFRDLADASPAMFWVTDINHSATFLSKGWCDYTGQSLEEALGFGWLDAVNPDDRERAKATFVEAAGKRQAFQVDYRLKNALGEYRWAADFGRPRFDRYGAFVGYIGSAIDIHDRVLAENAIREHEEHLKVALTAGRMGTWVWDIASNIVSFDELYAEQWGLEAKPGKLHYDQIVKYVLPEDLPRLRSQELASASPETFSAEFRIVRPDGEERWLRSSAMPVYDESGNIKQQTGVITDITESKNAHDLQRAAEERLRLAQSIAEVGTFDWDIKNDINVWSPELEVLYGIEPGTFEGTLDDWARRVHPDDMPAASADAAKSLETGQLSSEWRVIWPNGEVHWLAARARVFYDSNGEPARMLGVNLDITDQKKYEQILHETREDLERRVADRTTELRAANITLNKRNDELRRLTSQLTLAEQRERQRLAKVLHDHLQQILVAVQYKLRIVGVRIADDQQEVLRDVGNLIQEAIEASRSLAVELAPPILQEAGLAEGLAWLVRLMHDRHGLTVNLTREKGLSVSDEKLKLLFFESVRELLFNAVKHAQATSVSVDMRSESDNWLRIDVVDDGKGFEPDHVAESDIDKKVGGFGLATIRERLTWLGGRFEIHSEPGNGARFVLVAPLDKAIIAQYAEAAQSPVAIEAAETRPPKRKAADEKRRIRVLLVDDHSVMRQGLAMLLGEESDIEVIGEAADGLDAIEAAGNLRPDVVLMDCSLPRLDGVGATGALVAADPDVCVIGLSMFEEVDRARAMIDAGAVAYVSKSGNPAGLLETIRKFAG